MAHLGILGKRSVSEGIAAAPMNCSDATWYSGFACHVVTKGPLSASVLYRNTTVPAEAALPYFQQTPFLGNWQSIDYEGVVVQRVTFARLRTH